MSDNPLLAKVGVEKYPAWLFYFPMYVMLFSYALMGETGYIIVADAWTSMSSFEFTLYYLITYGVFFPVIFLSQYVFYRILSNRFGVHWRDFSRLDKFLIALYGILGFIFYLWVERIFGVNAPYDPTWDFDIGAMHVFWGDIVCFFIMGPLLLAGFHGINWAICHKKENARQYQYRFFLVVLGTAVLGTITQDWFWWVSAPPLTPPWGPGITIYFYFTDWIQVPFTQIYIPVVYLIVALVSLAILFVAKGKLFSFKHYLFWCVGPYLLLLLVGNILFYAV